MWTMSGSDPKSGPDPREVPTLNASDKEDVGSGEAQRALPMHAVPWLIVTLDEVRRLPIDPRVGFIVSLIDGRSTVEMIVDLAGFPRALTLRMLVKLLALGAIELHMGTVR